jgi:hypothetical protein
MQPIFVTVPALPAWLAQVADSVDQMPAPLA